MNHISILKGAGYLVSTMSVALLGVVSWNSASQQPILLACLVLGMMTSMAGMTLRWLSHRSEQHQNAKVEAKAERANASAPPPSFPLRNRA